MNGGGRAVADPCGDGHPASMLFAVGTVLRAGVYYCGLLRLWRMSSAARTAEVLST
jgi:hypothetical protein